MVGYLAESFFVTGGFLLDFLWCLNPLIRGFNSLGISISFFAVIVKKCRMFLCNSLLNSYVGIYSYKKGTKMQFIFPCFFSSMMWFCVHTTSHMSSSVCGELLFGGWLLLIWIYFDNDLSLMKTYIPLIIVIDLMSEACSLTFADKLAIIC